MKFIILIGLLILAGCTITEATYESAGTIVSLKRTQLWGEDVDFSVSTERGIAELKKTSNSLTPEQQQAILGVLFP